eukprot:3535689-Rhodomonas_salina.1
MFFTQIALSTHGRVAADSNPKPAVVASEGVTKRRCSLLGLPSSVLGRAFPAERVVLGLRVCKQLRKELLGHAGSALLVKRADAEIHNIDLVEDLNRVSHLKLALRWAGEVHELASASSLRISLVHLELRHNFSSETPALAAEEVGTLAGVVGECKALVHLDLKQNRIGAEGARRLAGVLGECKALAYLDLSYNDIGAEGAGSLAGMLGGCKALAHLVLSWNGIRAEGAGMLAGALGKCKALAHLDLSRNGIGTEGAGCLA